MKTRLYLAVFVMTALAIITLLMNRRYTSPPPAIASHPTAIPASEPHPVVPHSAVPSGSFVVPAAETEATTPVVQTEMETVKFSIRDYRAALGGNPVGNNAEITKALGPKFIRDSRMNEKSELVDHWGTPYFFHALSAREMEIHSAGPDKKMWTSDDIVLR